VGRGLGGYGEKTGHPLLSVLWLVYARQRLSALSNKGVRARMLVDGIGWFFTHKLR
jgi:hypothetical protein